MPGKTQWIQWIKMREEDLLWRWPFNATAGGKKEETPRSLLNAAENIHKKSSIKAKDVAKSAPQ